jgi:hypothetical protein
MTNEGGKTKQSTHEQEKTEDAGKPFHRSQDEVLKDQRQVTSAAAPSRSSQIQHPASTSRFQARQSTIDMLRLRHGRHRVSAGGMASRGAAGILSTCHDLRGGESAAGRAKSDPKPEPSLVSMGNLRVGNRVARAWPERLLVSLVGIAPRADDPARVTTPRAFAAAVAAIGGKIDSDARNA